MSTIGWGRASPTEVILTQELLLVQRGAAHSDFFLMTLLSCAIYLLCHSIDWQIKKEK
ncbi:MAG: hypothetical protein KME49_15515 [Brasilonema octagenarum HA4186-MV1]|uniref:hypothetical protein n=1 Tax=Brasilonema TaxID=383614 RepID=UPI00145E4E0E|nr:MULTISPECIES: hypothetical protein [Brasilonema]MBW4626864.1 hypothetical protein [Brasilonema octagenarum HA4186-MV1]